MPVQPMGALGKFLAKSGEPDLSAVSQPCRLHPAFSIEFLIGPDLPMGIEFPDNLLNRKSFASIKAIEDTVKLILDGKEAA